jgi:hypothetical protein
MSDDRVPKRIIPAQKPALNRANISNLASVDHMLDDALGILETELIGLKVKQREGHKLKLAESRVLVGYIKSLVELSKEQRERDSQKNFGDMSDEELLEHFKQRVDAKKLAGA